MKTTSVDRLFDENYTLELEKAELRKRITNDLARVDEIEQRQAAIRSSVQVKSAGATRRASQPARPRTAAKRRTAVGRKVVTAVSSAAPTGKAKSDAERIREYIANVDDDSVITTESVAATLGIESPTASTALGRLLGKTIERVPGSKRGKFRKINRAA